MSRWISVISKNMNPKPERREVERRGALAGQLAPHLAHGHERQQQEHRGQRRRDDQQQEQHPLADRVLGVGLASIGRSKLRMHVAEAGEVPEERPVVADRRRRRSG